MQVCTYVHIHVCMCKLCMYRLYSIDYTYCIVPWSDSDLITSSVNAHCRLAHEHCVGMHTGGFDMHTNSVLYQVSALVINICTLSKNMYTVHVLLRKLKGSRNNSIHVCISMHAPPIFSTMR